MDVYGSIAVISSTAAWIELNRAFVEESLKASFPLKTILWQSGSSMLQLEGLLSASEGAAESQAGSPSSTQLTTSGLT